MRRGQFRRTGSTPQQLGTTKMCDLIRQGKKFKCLDLSLPPAEFCSHCRRLLVTS